MIFAARLTRAAVSSLAESDRAGMASTELAVSMPCSGLRRSCPSTARNMSRDAATSLE